MKKLLFLGFLLLFTINIFSVENYLDKLYEAIECYENQDLEASLKILITLEKQNIKDKKLYYYLGQNYFDRGNYELAEKYYNLSIELDPNYADPYFELSTIKINQKRVDEAHRLVLKGLELNPDSAKLHLNYSSVLTLLGESKQSKEEVINAAKIDPMVILDHANIMILSLNNNEAAMYYLEILVELYPRDPLFLYNASAVKKSMGNLDEAYVYSTFSYLIITRDHYLFDLVYSMYFRLCLELKFYKNIIRDAFKKVDENYASAYFFIALAYYKMGDNYKFKKNAEIYFDLSKETNNVPLEEWALEMLQDS